VNFIQRLYFEITLNLISCDFFKVYFEVLYLKYETAFTTREDKSIGFNPHSCTYSHITFSYCYLLFQLLYLDILNKNGQMLKNGCNAFQKIWPLFNFFFSVGIWVSR